MKTIKLSPEPFYLTYWYDQLLDELKVCDDISPLSGAVFEVIRTIL